MRTESRGVSSIEQLAEVGWGQAEEEMMGRRAFFGEREIQGHFSALGDGIWIGEVVSARRSMGDRQIAGDGGGGGTHVVPW